MSPRTIAVVAGGFSGEQPVSLRSAAGILSWIDRERYTPYLVLIDRMGWWVELSSGERYPIDKNDFSCQLPEGRIRPEYAYITIHGTPGENGLLQGYLDLLGIPYNTGGVLTEALTFNKYYCNHFLSSFPQVRTANSLRLSKDLPRPSTADILDRLGLPLFAKPNAGGSSVATSRVNTIEQLESAINEAFTECEEVLLERFISGTEVTCGCYEAGGGLQVLPVTEVVPKNSFFDYDAKYNGAVEEITPARIRPEQTELVQELTKQIYRYVDARGIIRVDFIIEADGYPTLLEVNTTPGMTPTSFIPQQVRAAGLEMSQVLTALIEEGLRPAQH